MSTVTNPNQPAGVSDSFLLPPPAHVMSPRADAAPKSPRSEAVTLIGDGETLEERLQPTLKEAKLALDDAAAEGAVRKLKLGIILGIFALFYCSTVIMCVSAAMIKPSVASVATSSDSPPSTWRIAILIHGVLSFFISAPLCFACVFSELWLQQVHEHKSFICELQGFMIANCNGRRHYAVVDLEIQEKVAGYPRRLMAIMGQPKRRGRVEGGEQMGRVKTTVAAEKRKTEKSAV